MTRSSPAGAAGSAGRSRSSCAPEVCRHLSRLGEYLRWQSSLAPALTELAICLTARHLRAGFEWHAHAPLAVAAGVPAAAIEAIRTGTAPHFTVRDQALVYRVVTELIETKRLGYATFAEATAAFGETGNAFEVALPPGTPPYFPQ